MNQHIKELAGQANIHFTKTAILDGDPNGTARFIPFSKLENFTKLVVQKYLLDFYKNHLDTTNQDDITKQIDKYVKISFGTQNE